MEKLKRRAKLNKTLLDLGLLENEVQIYLTINRSGDLTIAEINKSTGIPRTSIARSLEKLIKKSLVFKKTKNSVNKYCAENPRKFESLIDAEELDLETKLERVRKTKGELTNLIDSIKKEKESDVKEEITVKYYEGMKGFLDINNRTLDHAEDELCFFSNHNKWRKAYDVEYDTNIYVPKRVAKGIKNRSLVLNNKMGRQLKDSAKGILRTVKYLPKEFDFDTTFIIYKDNVSIMISDKPYTAINIQSKSVYKTFQNIFDYFWDICK